MSALPVVRRTAAATAATSAGCACSITYVIPEVLLKELADAGYRLEQGLARAVAGTPGTGPNAVHRLAADVLRAGGQVWTTNWDTWVERAWAETADGWPPRCVAVELHCTVPASETLEAHKGLNSGLFGPNAWDAKPLAHGGRGKMPGDWASTTMLA